MEQSCQGLQTRKLPLWKAFKSSDGSLTAASSGFLCNPSKIFCQALHIHFGSTAFQWLKFPLYFNKEGHPSDNCFVQFIFSVKFSYVFSENEAILPLCFMHGKYYAGSVFSTVFPTNKFFSKLNTITQIALGQTLAICGLKKFWVYLNCKKIQCRI